MPDDVEGSSHLQSDTSEATLARAREALERWAWAEAFDRFSAAEEEIELEPDDLQRLATAAYLVGRDDDSADAWERAHHMRLRGGDVEGAIRSAFWASFVLANTGDTARAGGWLARARRLLDNHPRECVERGYVLVPIALQRAVGGDWAAAHPVASQAAEIGARFGDVDLLALARSLEGRALIGQGQVGDGMAVLDEVMVAVIADRASAMVTGTVYCSVIEACQEVFDHRRAREWTAQLTRWCDAQPDLVPFSGHCLVHRAEIMHMHGEWTDALEEARRAGERLQRRPQPAVGAALYQQAEVHRLRGEFALAEKTFRQAGLSGHQAQPGLALLRLAQGAIGAAQATIRRAVDEADDRLMRSRLLPALVEILVAAGDDRAARSAADELSEIAESVDAALLSAAAAQSHGAVLLLEGEPGAALVALRRAWTSWHELEVPYEAARVRLLIGRACRELGDADAAKMEIDAATAELDRLGAAPDLVRAQERTSRHARGLTARELEVLRLVATGKTNRAIAADLVLSERTVARHISNIFAKLDLSTRAAATAYAYQHRLV